MIKNITLSADEHLIEAARTKAQQERTTLNGAFRDWLIRYAGKRMNAEDYARFMERMKHVSPGKKFSRDELNER